MITNNGESAETKKKQPGHIITVSTPVWNYLQDKKKILKNEHEDNINKLLKDREEYLIAVPVWKITYAAHLSGQETKTIRISDELYHTLNALRGEGIIRTREAEYSYARVLNDLLHQSVSLRQIIQKGMAEKEKLFCS